MFGFDAQGGEAARKKEGEDEGEDGGDDDDETPVDEDALVSHHMPGDARVGWVPRCSGGRVIELCANLV